MSEALIAYKYRFPEHLEISIKKSEDGGYIAFVDNLPGCMTQAETSQELFETVHDAVYTYLKIPKHYKIYMPTFFPPEEWRKEMGIKIPNKYLEGKLMLQQR
ncbi:type II toxin-antitoxin system HicB family antitoxin [Candidatus Falkowbacteria bacterium]|nr:type II toxin-antitoxin system HicB family antitoxin [Candidatus Falkowbacteria bacterium]